MRNKTKSGNMQLEIPSRLLNNPISRGWHLPPYFAVTMFVAALLARVLMLKRRTGHKSRSEEKQVNVNLSNTAAFERKRGFLSRAGNVYGYASSPCGHIDTWRTRELPNLIAPLGRDRYRHENSNEPEVYLDYAGAALPTTSQLQKIMETSQLVLANPHSTGPAASRTSLLVEQAKKVVMDHFQCHPGRFYGLSNVSPTTVDAHPGYEVIFTSGATESLRLVAERFPWFHCDECSRKSVLVYPQNSHTSVVGMRGPAQARGATFLCQPLSSISNADVDRLADTWGQQNNNATSNTDTGCKCYSESMDVNHLLAFPAECNFGGERPDVKSIVATARAASSNYQNQRWFTMLDLAKAATTGPINLRDLDPDFACISFYKMFGEPTGLGALFVKKTAVEILMGSDYSSNTYVMSPPSPRYFGGGSVDAILPRISFMAPRLEPSPLVSLVNGTIHYRGIASLVHGFNELDRLGGMAAIRRHSTCLARELTRRFKLLRHGNGSPVVIIYGAWADLLEEKELASSHHSCLRGGPTVAFNVLRSDGSFVGYNEVSKLAALNRPPLQLRAGCFCNPGACQDALELSDEEVQDNYLTSGHVCGDQIDIINEKPTGAIRASFGKDSIWEDMDALVTFVENMFVNRHIENWQCTPEGSVEEKRLLNLEPTTVQLSEMYIYPIKSCAPQRVKKWKMNQCGRLAFDREFALVDASGTAMRLQSYPRMGLLQPIVDTESRTLTVSAPEYQDLVLNLDDNSYNKTSNNGSSTIKVCGNRCGGRLWGDYAASEWFSSFLGCQCWLARYFGGQYIIPTSEVDIAPSETVPSSPTLPHRRLDVAFANEEPLLLISEHAVAALNDVLSLQGQRLVNTRHFRPNLVVRSFLPADDVHNGTGSSSVQLETNNNPEDTWSRLVIHGKNVEFDMVGHCARCAMVDVDPTSGMKGNTLRALAEYRRKKGQITFGIFLQKATHEEAEGASTGEEVMLEEGDLLDCFT